MPSIIVTGATSGIGRAIAERFANDGWHVVATGRRADRLRELKEAFPDLILPLELDVRDKDAVLKGFSTLPAAWAEPEVLVNNAGLALGLTRAWEASLEEWENMVQTNILGVLYCTRAILPGMVSRKKGYVFNLGSIAGSVPSEGNNVYGGTKAFVSQFSAGLRCDLHGSGVRVTNIEPGMLESEFFHVRFQGDAENIKKRTKGGKLLEAKNLADCVHWLVQQPSYVDVTRLELMPTNQSNGGMRMFSED